MKARSERGSAVVELPMCICIVFLLAFGCVTLVQVMWTHIHLASSARDVTRYAARVEYDPSATTLSSNRRRTATEVANWAAEVAAEAGVTASDVTVTVSPSNKTLDTLSPGDTVTVTIQSRVNNPLYQFAASATNAFAGLFHAQGPFDPTGVTVQASASTYVE